MCIATVKIHCHLVKVYGVCVIPCKQVDMVALLSAVAGQLLTDIDLGTKHVHYRQCVAYRQFQLLKLPEN